MTSYQFLTSSLFTNDLEIGELPGLVSKRNVDCENVGASDVFFHFLNFLSFLALDSDFFL